MWRLFSFRTKVEEKPKQKKNNIINKEKTFEAKMDVLQRYKANVSSHQEYQQIFLNLAIGIHRTYQKLDKNGQSYYKEIYHNVLDLTEPFTKQLKKLDGLFVFVCFGLPDLKERNESKIKRLKEDLETATSIGLQEALTRNINNMELEIQSAEKRKEELVITELNIENCLSILNTTINAFSDLAISQQDKVFLDKLKSEIKDMQEAIKEVKNL